MAPYSSLLPLLFATGYFIVAIGIFSLLTLRRGLPADAEVTGRPASRLLGRYLRHYMMWVLAPYERALVRLRISPNTLTLASLVAALTAGGLLAAGRFGIGGWLYLFTGILDILDGRVARATGRVSRGGAFFDSVIDRYAELAVFSGLAFYYRDTWILGVVLAAAVGSVMVSYVRARGESLGVDVKIGMMQRPERLFYLGLCVAQSPVWEAFFPTADKKPLYGPTVLALVLLGVSANITAIRRIVHTLRRLDAPPEAGAPANAAGPETAARVAAAAESAEPAVANERRRLGGSVEASARRLLARLRPVG